MRRPDATVLERMSLQSIVEVKASDLTHRGFTVSGSQEFATTVYDFASTLLKRCVVFGENNKAPNMPAEIAHDHVRMAALSMSRSFGAPSRSAWSIASQVCEYLATAVAGIGGGHLDKPTGIAVFALGISFAVVLFVTRLASRRGE